MSLLFINGYILLNVTGVSANADPHTTKLRTRETHIWGCRRRQPNRSAVEGPPPGKTALKITVSPVTGEYAYVTVSVGLKVEQFFNETVYDTASKNSTIVKLSVALKLLQLCKIVV